MRYAFLIVLLAGCAGPATMADEARPFAPEALTSREGLERYLEAAGVDIVESYVLTVTLRMVGVTRASEFDFRNGGTCRFYTYATPNEAVQRGPEYGRLSGFEPGPRIGSAPQLPLRFGATVGRCSGLPPGLEPALKALDAFAQADPARVLEGE